MDIFIRIVVFLPGSASWMRFFIVIRLSQLAGKATRPSASAEPHASASAASPAAAAAALGCSSHEWSPSAQTQTRSLHKIDPF
eukprot:COSAG06_NODE_11144_length_1557_cov_2.814815_1_plen_83_part_00